MHETEHGAAAGANAAGIASEDEARAFLARHPEIEAVQLVITDPNGGRARDGLRLRVVSRHGMIPERT